MIWAKLEIVGCKSLYISSFYNPKTSDEQSLKWFDISVRRASQIKNAALLIGGDFNLPNIDWKNNIVKPNSSHQRIHYYFCNTLDDVGLTQLVKQSTRKDNILDLVITNLPNQVPRMEIMPGISDHDIVFFEFNITPAKIKQIPRNIPLYNRANLETIRVEINSLNNKLQKEANTRSVNELWNIFKTKLNDLITKHIPHKKLSSKPNTPWVTPKLRSFMKKRDRLYSKMKKVEIKTWKINTSKWNTKYKNNLDRHTGLTSKISLHLNKTTTASPVWRNFGHILKVRRQTTVG